MVLKHNNGALEFRLSISPRRYTNCNEACIEVGSENPKASIRLSVEYLKQCETFHGREIRLAGYGLLRVKDNVGNLLEPPLVVYPKFGELPESCQPKSGQDRLIFTFDEWLYFMDVLSMFKAWYKSGNGFYGTGW